MSWLGRLRLRGPFAKPQAAKTTLAGQALDLAEAVQLPHQPLEATADGRPARQLQQRPALVQRVIDAPRVVRDPLADRQAQRLLGALPVELLALAVAVGHHVDLVAVQA